jgi:hypothetical protein
MFAGTGLILVGLGLYVFQGDGHPTLSVLPGHTQVTASVEPGTEVRWKYRIVNDAPRSQQVFIAGKSCSCIAAVMSDASIAPLKSVDLEVSMGMPLDGYATGSVYIQTSAGEQHALTFLATPALTPGLSLAPIDVALHWVADDVITVPVDLSLRLSELDGADSGVPGDVKCTLTAVKVEPSKPWRRLSEHQWASSVKLSIPRAVLRAGDNRVELLCGESGAAMNLRL